MEKNWNFCMASASITRLVEMKRNEGVDLINYAKLMRLEVK